MTRDEFLDMLNKVIEDLEEALSLYHDASEHKYVEDPENPGMCSKCGWFSLESPIMDCCGGTLREHFEEYLYRSKELRRLIVTNESYFDQLMQKMMDFITAIENRHIEHQIFPYSEFPTVCLN